MSNSIYKYEVTLSVRSEDGKRSAVTRTEHGYSATDAFAIAYMNQRADCGEDDIKLVRISVPAHQIALSEKEQAALVDKIMRELVKVAGQSGV